MKFVTLERINLTKPEVNETIHVNPVLVRWVRKAQLTIFDKSVGKSVTINCTQMSMGGEDDQIFLRYENPVLVVNALERGY